MRGRHLAGLENSVLDENAQLRSQWLTQVSERASNKLKRSAVEDMGWIEEQFERRSQPGERPEKAGEASEFNFESTVERGWQELKAGLKRDIDEFRRLGGDAEFKSHSEFECEISNPASAISAVITADVGAHNIHYSFTSKAESAAVPEGGFFSLRRSASGKADLYSADQRISIEQAQRMILEPLLFPSPPPLT